MPPISLRDGSNKQSGPAFIGGHPFSGIWAALPLTFSKSPRQQLVTVFSARRPRLFLPPPPSLSLYRSVPLAIPASSRVSSLATAPASPGSQQNSLQGLPCSLSHFLSSVVCTWASVLSMLRRLLLSRSLVTSLPLNLMVSSLFLSHPSAAFNTWTSSRNNLLSGLLSPFTLLVSPCLTGCSSSSSVRSYSPPRLLNVGEAHGSTLGYLVSFTHSPRGAHPGLSFGLFYMPMFLVSLLLRTLA